ncbi:helix-turn-helix domain-containing protein [SAR202 cluster bacterium AC-647-N09_OGT_505m]|nr:helix-turn-helix domain-containing protein [SAR202 cluster bacterium AC-647-N09_OGT_505m]
MVGGKRGFSMSEACDYVGGVSRQQMYRLMREGELRSYLIGNRRYFLKEELDSFLERQMEKAE